VLSRFRVRVMPAKWVTGLYLFIKREILTLKMGV
jgi:hypothetical protein